MGSTQRTHLAPLGDTGWAVWRDIVLRGAGFPADAAKWLSDQRLAAAADAAVADPALLDAYRAEHAAATDRLSAVTRKVAQWPLFREAVAWQNPKLVKSCLDKLADERPRNKRGRMHEAAVAGYLQRYATKNDTIGFFGPVGWARWADGGPPLTVEAGAQGLLRRRTTYFETWAIDAVAASLSADPELRPLLAPRLPAAHRLDGATLHVAGRGAIALSPAESATLSCVDGARSVHDIAAALRAAGCHEIADPAAVLAVLDSLLERELVHLDLIGPIDAWPERALLAKLERIAPSIARERAIAKAQALLAARDQVAAAAGDDVALEPALAELGARFTAITGIAGERRAGQMYAGRTLVYEDTVRDVDVALGPAVREQLARPLQLLLDSARWLVAEIGAEYEQLLTTLHERRAAQSGNPVVPLASIVSLATPQLYWRRRQLAPPVQRAVDELQRRWASVLTVPSDARRVQLASGDLAAGVAEQFPPRPLPWVTGSYHSPDLMLAAPDAAAVERGDYLLVLGELHVSFNTLEHRAFVEQHDDRAALLAAVEADLGDRRVCFLPSRDIPTITSRAMPPTALPSPGYTYWTMRRESIEPPAPILPAADLVVRREDGQLVVRTTAGRYVAPLLNVLGEQLSSASLNAFKPVPRAAHSPRLTIDRLVIARESWAFRAGDLAWAQVTSEPGRFLAARAWRQRHDLPETVFYDVAVEEKPSYVDFTSLPYVNALAKVIHRAVAKDADGAVTFTEMLPDPSQLWLTDADGARYTCELRFVAVDQRA